DTDCESGEVCDGGACVPNDEAEIASLVILTTSQVLTPGDRVPVLAVALDADGNIIRGADFELRSRVPAVGDFDGNVFVAGDSAGATGVFAQASDDGPFSQDVEIENLGVPVGVVQIVAVDASTGQRVRDFQLLWTSNNSAISTTGSVELEPGGIADVHLFAEGYDAVSVYADFAEGSYVIPLPPLTVESEVGGFTGEMDFSSVTTVGDASVGLAGAALGGQLVNFTLNSILGDPVNTEIAIPGLGGQAFALPGGLVLSVEFFGIGDVKGEYLARADDGLTFAWALGGKVQINDLIDLFTGGGAGDIGGILAAILPLFESFDHDVAVFESNALPLEEDRDDIDGDGVTDELLPNYSAFPNLDLEPDEPQRYRTEVRMGELPSIGGVQSEVVLVVGGVLVDGVGFVPTGLNAVQSVDGAAPEPIVLRMAPSHGGLGVGDFAVVAVSFTAAGTGVGADGLSLPSNISARMFIGPRLPELLDFSADGFATLDQGAVYNEDTRALSYAVGTADVAHVTFVGDAGRWHVWTDSTINGLSLPVPPEGATDYRVGALLRLDGLLTEGNSIADLAAAGGPSLLNVDRSAIGFSRVETAP
ncbi:MAG: hypothetical protein ACJA1R_000096, partial [Flavobacteriales bacterium]